MTPKIITGIVLSIGILIFIALRVFYFGPKRQKEFAERKAKEAADASQKKM